MFNRELKEKLNSLISFVYNDVMDKIEALYKTDKHGTERPKVDILDDDVFRGIRSMETDIYELQEKMEKLKKKK